MTSSGRLTWALTGRLDNIMHYKCVSRRALNEEIDFIITSGRLFLISGRPDVKRSITFVFLVSNEEPPREQHMRNNCPADPGRPSGLGVVTAAGGDHVGDSCRK